MSANTTFGNDPNRAFKAGVSSPVEELLLASLQRGDNSFQTGQYLVTFENGAVEESLKFLETRSMRIADARDFENQALTMESLGDAEALLLPEIGVAVITSDAARERNLGVQSAMDDNRLVKSIDPDYFVFAENGPGNISNGHAVEKEFVEDLNDISKNAPGPSSEYLRGFLRAATIIAKDLQQGNDSLQFETEVDARVLGATWGLVACRVPASIRSGAGIKVAVLGTGFDPGHPDFTGRTIVGQTFVGQPVQDLNGHGTHMIGTACGPRSPAGNTPRYGIAYGSSIFAGKVLTNSGTGTTAGVLAGMHWAIANRCPVICAPLAMPGGPLPAFEAAGQAALNAGCLIIAGSSSAGSQVGAPANSNSIMSIAALEKTLVPAPFSPIGKIDIAAPGTNIFSSYKRPMLYQTWNGLASAAAHVAGCAALWAQTSPLMRGLNLRRQLLASAKRLPFPPTRVGSGLVQAP